MGISICHQLSEIPAESWNALGDGDNPFIRHEFLSAMEANDCLGEEQGWLPHHILFHGEDETLLGAIPLYLKDNSYGEFVFDWGWADAYHRNGIEYYPKLVSSIPYTPAQGPRILLHPDADRESVATALIDASVSLAQEMNLSSLHYLFTLDEDTRRLHEKGLILRMGVQYHWHNRGYKDFDDYLSHFASKKRKNVRQERRKVQQANIDIEIRHGDEIPDELWPSVHHYYEATFYKKGGYPTLTQAFFRQVARSMPRNLVVFLARHEGKYVAASICFRGEKTLYGRHWGCDERFDSLHFELCYYQGLDYAIQQGLEHFEPGAQGEHKVSRGFEPTATWSAHWIAHPQFAQAIADHCQREQRAMEHYIESLHEHLPFRSEQA
ncbi:MAG: N-acetyltransferase [Gammaproteobacteria bacterium]|nr:N-acetyltransferase [Gammaproteobacteria bacterium]